MTLRILGLALLSSSIASAEPSAKQSCPACRAKAMAAESSPSCCKDEAGGAYTRGSIYQLEARFIDDTGRPYSLGSLRGSPVVIDMFYASCGSACPLTVTDMLAIQSRLTPGERSKTVFVLVSFDGQRDTPAALARYRAQRHLDGQWVLLDGSSDSVRELAALLGVKYKRGEDGSYAHSNLLTILNPEGEIIHQRTGLQGGLEAAVSSLAASAKKDIP